MPLCLTLPHYCETAFPRKLQFVIAMFGFAWVCFLQGPSQLLGFPDNYWLIIAGFPLMGVFQYFVFIPIIPEMLERLQVDFNIVEGEDEAIDGAINDKVNDAYGFVFALANFVGPTVGGALKVKYEAPTTSDI